MFSKTFDERHFRLVTERLASAYQGKDREGQMELETHQPLTDGLRSHRPTGLDRNDKHRVPSPRPEDDKIHFEMILRRLQLTVG